jgi:hypothetical protein
MYVNTMKHWIWLWMPLVAACGARTATTMTPPGSAPAATAGQDSAPAIPCPGHEAIAETARAAWDQDTGTAVAECVALRHGGGTVWILDGWFEPEPNADGLYSVWTALVRPDGEVLWRDGHESVPYGALVRRTADDWTAADLDGDGNDEVLYVASYDHGGHLNSELMAGAIVEGRLDLMAEGIPLSRDNSAAAEDEDEIETCDGAWELVPAGDRRHVAITYTGPDCEQPGRHLFAWDGKELIRRP